MIKPAALQFMLNRVADFGVESVELEELFGNDQVLFQIKALTV